MAASYRRPVPAELLLASFAAVAVGIWRLRRSRARAVKLAADIAQRVHRHEIPKAEASMTLATQRFSRACLESLKILALFALSIVIAALFLGGFPLHAYWRPWGPVTMTASFFFLIVFLLDAVGWMAELSSWKHQKLAHERTHKRLKKEGLST